MDNIDKAIITLNDSTAAAPWVTLRIDPRCQIIITLVYLGVMLSVPLTNLEQLIWYAVYPLVWSTLCGTRYSLVMRRSLIVLPFIAFIGIFNPLLDHAPALVCFGVVVSRGWITFISIIVRGLLSVQAVVVLIINIGFVPMCRAFGSLGMPQFMVTQLMLLYRYMIVLLQELQTMSRARQSRGLGRKLTLRLWGIMIGQLFVRTIARAERIQQAMLARGFNGRLRFASPDRAITVTDVVTVIVWIGVFVAFRFINIPALLHFQ